MTTPDEEGTQDDEAQAREEADPGDDSTPPASAKEADWYNQCMGTCLHPGRADPLTIRKPRYRWKPPRQGSREHAHQRARRSPAHHVGYVKRPLHKGVARS